MRVSSVLSGACLAILLFAPAVISAQSTLPADVPPSEPSSGEQAAASPGRRPRIGLALGGGSARGIAHIGVLEWFEQHRIPIDYIAGTSMGGLVAGSYASGMSPQELRQLMAGVDWDLMFISDSPYKYKTFRRKQDRRAYPAQLEFGLKHGITLPGGLNPGQQVTLLLDRIALPYYDLATFDDLPTPFRCVATDLNKADVVVLGKGPLAQAMRATMAIPGVFTPVNYENWLLVDGGALNNIPANVVKQMGADVVIAVNVGADADVDQKAQESLFALLGRTIDTMMTAGVRTGLKDADLVIDPDLKGLDSMSWRRSGELADRGVEGAEQMKDRLLPYALGEDEYRAFMATRQARRRTAIPAADRVVVTGVGDPEQAEVAEALAGNVGAPIDWARVSQDIMGVTGSDRYEYLTYRLQPATDGTELRVHVRPKRYGPPFLAIGPELSNVDSSNFAVNLGARVTAYDWVGKGSETRVDVGLGTRQLLAGELYRPLGRTRLFVAPRAYFVRTPRNGYLDERLQAEYRFKRTGAGIDLGYSTGRRSEVRFGVDAADVRGRIRVGSPFLPEVQGGEKAVSLQFAFDGQTSPQVPSRGLFTRTWLRHYHDQPEVVGSTPGALENVQKFWQGEVEGNWFLGARGGRDRVFVRFGAGTSFGDDPLITTFSLGGPLRLGAFNNDELRGPNYLLGTVGYLRGIGRMPDVLGGGIFAGAWFEQGTAFRDWTDATYHNSVSFGGILETLLGPLFGGGSVDFDGRYRLYIAIGPLFR